jgi:hypothetical protein
MKKNLPLIIGLAIPVLMIVFVAAAIYIPSLFAHPQYSFVFSAGDTYSTNYGDHYSVVKNTIVKNTVPYPKDQNNAPYPKSNPIGLFVYNAKTDSVSPITFEEAQKLTVDISSKSPDGYILDRGGNNNGIFEIFGSNRNYNEWYLKKGVVSKKVYLTAQNDRYGYNGYYDQFLGWVISGDISTK